jgi:regulator of nucleoside diphosphate kinase
MENLIISNLDFSRIRERAILCKDRNPVEASDMEKIISGFKNAKIIEPSEIPEDVVTMHSKVLIRDIYHNKTYTLQLVFPEDADRKKNRISIFSTIARALLGKKVGDMVTWKSKTGEMRIKIEYIIYQPEACGDYHL